MEVEGSVEILLIVYHTVHPRRP